MRVDRFDERACIAGEIARQSRAEQRVDDQTRIAERVRARNFQRS
jgi:hypothetical protein